jgi:hypothetical protein
MFQLSNIQSNLQGLIGWKQSINPTYAVVDSDNLKSDSGAYFQDYSSLVTIENIHQNQNYPAISDAQLNTLLGDIYESAIVKVLNNVFQSNDFIENKVLYPFESSYNEKLDNDTSFVGFELEQPTRRELINTINKLILTFDDVDTVKILVFHSSRQAPIFSQEITTVADSDKEEVVNITLTKEYNGGKFYIGYLRSGLTAKAINRGWDKANVRACYKALKINPIQVDGWDAETLFDVEDIDYQDKTYGLNFDITSWKDYTNLITQNKYKFVNALGLQVAIDVMDLILKSTRSNRIERIADSKVLFELEGIINNELPRVAGLRGKLQAEIVRLKQTFIETPLLSKGTL